MIRLMGAPIEDIGLYFLLFLFFFVLISTIIYVVIVLFRRRTHLTIVTRVERMLKERSCIEPFCERFRKKK
jgi:hypothetical protein